MSRSIPSTASRMAVSDRGLPEMRQGVMCRLPDHNGKISSTQSTDRLRIFLARVVEEFSGTMLPWRAGMITAVMV